MSAFPVRAVFSLKVDNIKPQLGQFIFLVPNGVIVVASDRRSNTLVYAICLPSPTMSRSFTYRVLAYRTRRTALLRGVTMEISISSLRNLEGFRRPAPLRHIWAETSQSC